MGGGVIAFASSITVRNSSVMVRLAACRAAFNREGRLHASMETERRFPIGDPATTPGNAALRRAAECWPRPHAKQFPTIFNILFILSISPIDFSNVPITVHGM